MRLRKFRVQFRRAVTNPNRPSGGRRYYADQPCGFRGSTRHNPSLGIMVPCFGQLLDRTRPKALAMPDVPTARSFARRGDLPRGRARRRCFADVPSARDADPLFPQAGLDLHGAG